MEPITAPTPYPPRTQVRRTRATILVALVVAMLGSILGTVTSLVSPLPASAGGVPKPVSTIVGPHDVMLGQKFTFAVTFQNKGDMGYGPFVDLAVSTRGADGLVGTQPLPCDGVWMTGASISVTNGPLVLSSPGFSSTPQWTCTNLPHPDYGAPDGWQTARVMLQPFPSYANGQPITTVTVDAVLSNLADDSYPPIAICARGGFLSNASSLQPPTFLQHGNLPPSSWEGTCDYVTPHVLTMAKTYLGPESEAAAGPNLGGVKMVKYDLTFDVADGMSVGNVNIADTLPPNLTLASLGGNEVVVTSWTGLTTSTLFSKVTTCGSGLKAKITTPQPKVLNVQLCNPVVGTVGVNRDVVVTLTAFVNNDQASSVKESCSSNAVAVHNAVKVTADWKPIDTRDQSTKADKTIPVSGNGWSDIQARCLAVQKTARNTTRVATKENPEPKPLPADVIEYTLAFQVSDYHTIGGLVLTDFLGDGLELVAGTPRLTVSDQLGGLVNTVFTTPTLLTAPVQGPPPAPCSTVDPGFTRLTFNVSDRMIEVLANAGNAPARHKAGILTGGWAITSSAPSSVPATGTVTFRAIVRDVYAVTAPPKADPYVDSLDPITNCVEIKGDVLHNEPLTTKPTVSLTKAVKDTSQRDLTILEGTFNKTVVAVNGEAVKDGEAPPEVAPKQSETFQLSLTLPSSDAEKIVLEDWVPTAFPVSGFPTAAPVPCATAATIPVSGACWWLDGTAGATYLQPTALVGVDVPNNHLTFTMGSINASAGGSRTLSIRFSIARSATAVPKSTVVVNHAWGCYFGTVQKTGTAAPSACPIAIAKVPLKGT